MKNFYKKGISIIEVLAVIAIIGVLISVVSFQLSKSREQQVLKNAAADTLSSINKARTQTLSSLNSSVYGIHFESNNVIIFKGTVFNVNDASNEIVDIIAPANISNVTLGGVGGVSGEMYFNRLYGVPSKTGTITKGVPEVTDIIPLNNFSNKSVLEIAASIEKGSEHPLADAIVNKAKAGRINLKKVKDFKAIPGFGVTAKIASKKYYLGNMRLMNKFKIKTKHVEDEVHDIEEEAKTVMLLAENNKLIGIIAVADQIKETSSRAVKDLQELGLEVYMITGDNKRTANAIGRNVGIKNIFAEVLPEDKAKYVKLLQKKGTVAMVGDGINDAPALAHANIGIAMGSGTDVAMETGNIVLMKNDLLDVAKSIKLSKMTMSKIKENMFWALIYNVIGIPIAAGILYPSTGWLLSPIIAGGAMALSSVSVVMNSLHLKLKKL